MSLLPENSSLKKMSGVQGRKEGSYASLERVPWSRFTNDDPGLTLLPGSQIQRKDEKKLLAAAESSPKKSGSRYVGRTAQWKSFDTVVQQNHPTEEAAFFIEAKSASSCPDPGLDSAILSHVTARTNQERPLSHTIIGKDGSGVAQQNTDAVTSASCDEQTMASGETGDANNFQPGDSSPRTVKGRKLDSRASSEMQDLRVSRGKEAAFESHDRSHVLQYQDLFGVRAAQSQIRRLPVATFGVNFSGVGGGFGSSKPESRWQITNSPYTPPARSHKSMNRGCEDRAPYSTSSALAALASRSPVKHQYFKKEKLTVQYKSPKPSETLSTTHRKYFPLLPESSGENRRQVLKRRKEVNGSWTSHFPAKANSPRCANLPAPSFLKAPFTPSKDHQYPQPNNFPTSYTNLHAYTHFLSTHRSLSLPNRFSHSKAFNHSLDVCTLEDISETALTGNQRQSARRRSDSMPNLSPTCVPKNMDPFNSFGPISIPTPPREQSSSPAFDPCPSSLSHYDNTPFRENLVGPPHDYVDTSYNPDNSSSQNWQFKSNFQRQHENGLSNRPNISFTPNLHPRQVLTQPSHHQDMAGPPVLKDGATAAGGPQYSRRRLEIKPNYSHEEVKFFMFTMFKQAQVLKAENTTLEASNAAMKKGFESLQREKADLLQQTKHYERIVAQKDQQIQTMQRNGSTLQHQYKRVWDENRRLIATKRKADGTGNPSAIAKKIRLDHSQNPVGAASQSSQPTTNTSLVPRANGSQLPTSRYGFEQTPTGLQEHVQPAFVSGSPEANVNSISRQDLHQQEHTVANRNNAHPSQTVPNPLYIDTNEAKASSRALSQPGFPASRHKNAESLQPALTPGFPDTNSANTSSEAWMQPVYAAANHNSPNPSHDGSTRWEPSKQLPGASIGTVTADDQNCDRPIEKGPSEHVTIDLTDDSRPSLSSVSDDTSLHQTRQTPIQSGSAPFDLLPTQYLPAQYPAGNLSSSQYSSDWSSQNQMSQSPLPPYHDSQGPDLEAMQVQKEAIARMTAKPLTWLQGENPFRRGTRNEQPVPQPNSRRPSQSNAERHDHNAKSQREGSVAPLPGNATGRNTKQKAPKKAKVVLDAEAKKERAKGYRKTAAEKKKREKEIAKQSLQDGNVSNNVLRAQKQERRAAKGEKRREQAQKPSEEVGPRVPQKTLDGRLYQENTGVQQGMHEGWTGQPASDDRNSLFGDDEDFAMEIERTQSPLDADNSMQYEEGASAEEDVDPGLAAELEALLEAAEDAETSTGAEQDNAFRDEIIVPSILPGGEDAIHDAPSESEESEEE